METYQEGPSLSAIQQAMRRFNPAGGNIKTDRKSANQWDFNNKGVIYDKDNYGRERQTHYIPERDFQFASGIDNSQVLDALAAIWTKQSNGNWDIPLFSSLRRNFLLATKDPYGGRPDYERWN